MEYYASTASAVALRAVGLVLIAIENIVRGNAITPATRRDAPRLVTDLFDTSTEFRKMREKVRVEDGRLGCNAKLRRRKQRESAKHPVLTDDDLAEILGFSI